MRGESWPTRSEEKREKPRSMQTQKPPQTMPFPPSPPHVPILNQNTSRAATNGYVEDGGSGVLLNGANTPGLD